MYNHVMQDLHYIEKFDPFKHVCCAEAKNLLACYCKKTGDVLTRYRKCNVCGRKWVNPPNHGYWHVFSGEDFPMWMDSLCWKHNPEDIDRMS